MDLEQLENDLLNTITRALVSSDTDIRHIEYKYKIHEETSSIKSIKYNNTKIELENCNIIFPKKHSIMTSIIESITEYARAEFIDNTLNESNGKYTREDIEKIYNELIGDYEICRMLFAGIYVDTLIQKNPLDINIDYSFGIVNNIKAIEKYIVCYLKKVKEIFSLPADSRNNIFATERKDKTWEEVVTLGNLIPYLSNNKRILINPYNNRKLINSLYFFKNNMRNGYFHKDILENVKNVHQINFKCYVLLIQLILNLKKQ